MKLLEIRHFDPNTTSQLPTVVMGTDSSIAIGHKPVFLPEISEQWALEISPAYRICRLGKTISQRFASRYYDVMTLAARVIPTDLTQRLCDEGQSPLSPLATAFDSAISVGEWIEPKAEFSLELISPTQHEPIAVKSAIDSAIAYISKTFIVKNGDIIMAGGPIIRIPVKIGDRVIASVDGREILSFNIK